MSKSFKWWNAFCSFSFRSVQCSIRVPVRTLRWPFLNIHKMKTPISVFCLVLCTFHKCRFPPNGATCPKKFVSGHAIPNRGDTLWLFWCSTPTMKISVAELKGGALCCTLWRTEPPLIPRQITTQTAPPDIRHSPVRIHCVARREETQPCKTFKSFGTGLETRNSEVLSF